MDNIDVYFQNDSYSIMFLNKFDYINSILNLKANKKVNNYFIVDEKVYYYNKEKIDGLIKSNSHNKALVIKISEEEKSYFKLEEIYNYFIDNNCNRDCVVIAIGGGVLGDLVGMSCATFMRGIKFINIPTTIIAQSDSSIGGKVAYNFKNIKNIIGTFYNPYLVIVNVELLKTLSKRDFNNGLGEIIKYALIDQDRELLNFIKNNKQLIKDKDSSCLEELIRRCLLIKKFYVEKDFKDKGLRNVLNFGHTIGHGIESISNYKIFHGEAVTLGSLVVLNLSNKIYGISLNIYNDIKDIINFFELPMFYKIDDYSRLINIIKKDKKNDQNIRFVLLKDIGKPVTKVVIKDDEIIRAINETINI